MIMNGEVSTYDTSLFIFKYAPDVIGLITDDRIPFKLTYEVK